MLNEAISQGEIVRAQKLIRHWMKLSEEMFIEQEKTTLIQQHILTDNSVLIRADGSLVKSSDLIDKDAIEVDPWLLISLQKLKEVFGDEIHNFIEIDDKVENPLS